MVYKCIHINIARVMNGQINSWFIHSLTYGSWPTNFVKYSCNTRSLV